MYFVELDSGTGELMSARLVPMQMRRFRLEHTSAADARWFTNFLNELGAPFGSQTRLDEDNSLILE